MKLILTDKTEFEITNFNFYYSELQEEAPNGIYEVRFDVPKNPSELLEEIRDKFTDENVAEVIIIKTEDGVDTTMTYNFSKMFSISMSINDNFGSINVRLSE